MTRMSFLLGTVAALTSLSGVKAEDLDFRTLYAAQSARTSINVDVADGEVLVFSAGPPIVLHGKRLVIAAKIARLDADLIIQQFDESDNAKPNSNVGAAGATGAAGRRSSGRNGAGGHPGGPGATGPDGLPGPNAVAIILDIDRLEGSAKLTINNNGGKGGKGGSGGKGGLGGSGEGGADGSDALAGCKAGGADGGLGGPGGVGGQGGRGGKGGRGGTIRAAPGLKDAVQKSMLVLSVDGGEGGPGGDGGARGDGGSGGAGGSGSTYCGGGDNGGGGSPGMLGSPGGPGLKGELGAIKID